MVRLRSERKQNVLGWSEFFCIKSSSLPFWPIGSGTKRTNLIWSKKCWRRSGTFLCNKKTYRSKQKVLIWSACFQNWSKIFWFGLLIIRTKAKRFDLVCLLSQLKQNILIWSAYYRNESKTFWFGLLIIGTKAKQFDLLLKLSQQKVSIWSIRTCIYQLQNLISRKLKKSGSRRLPVSSSRGVAIWSTINFKT